jgi:methylglutaconyl-CoA hydratase
MITYQVYERVARITLNRPDKRNALNPELITALKNAFKQAAEDEHVKVIVLAASGDAFCAGADLAHVQQLQKNTFLENRADSQHLRELYQQMAELDKIVVAQVQGAALAGGCGLATACDFIIASEKATFGYTEVKIGFIPAIVMIFLIRKIGDQRARALLLGGQPVSAHEALLQGLVFRVTTPEALEQEANEWVQHLVQTNSQEAMARTKTMLRTLPELPLAQALDYAVEQNAIARGTEDCKRGIAAFLEKRKITW